ncbi:MAG: glycosyltransferase family 39 protein [Candidatus Moranbacteria bacterium]|nr:glycosyltransferase family 39 protein [Candidatus Moranbacteria bacterium]
MKERIITILIFLVIVASSFYFGFHRLANFSGVDEPYWSYGRVPTFWNAIQKMKWKNTNISDKPGVPLAIVSGAGLPFIGENPKDLQPLRYDPKTPDQIQKIRDIYFKLRLPVFLFTLAMLPVFYWLIKKLLGKNVARFSLLFMGLSPVLLGISLIINSDALLWILTALSTLSLFVFLKGSERKFLILSGFFLGLSVITKYVANILLVYFFLVFFLEYIFHAHKKVAIGEYLKQALANYVILVLATMVTAFVFFPATWVKISTLIHATIGNKVFSSTWPLFVGLIVLVAADTFLLEAKFSNIIFGFLAKYRGVIAKFFAGLFLAFAAFVFLHVYGHVHIIDMQALISQPKGLGQGNGLQKYGGAISSDLYSLLFSVSPLILILILLSVVNIFRKKEMRRDTITVVYILIFLFIFYLGNAVNSVIATVRYQIIVYPLIFVVAAIGVSQFLEIKKVKKFVPVLTVYAVLIVVLLGSLFISRPNFLAYASEILPNNFIVNLKGMGEGSFEAASYLNSLPNAHDMTIWSDKGAVCEVFAGKCFIDFKKTTFLQNKIDYFVVSTDRRSRSLKMSKSLKNIADFEKIYKSNNYSFRFIINNNPNDFVKVFKASEFINQ